MSNSNNNNASGRKERAVRDQSEKKSRQNKHLYKENRPLKSSKIRDI